MEKQVRGAENMKACRATRHLGGIRQEQSQSPRDAEACTDRRVLQKSPETTQTGGERIRSVGHHTQANL